MELLSFQHSRGQKVQVSAEGRTLMLGTLFKIPGPITPKFFPGPMTPK